MTTKQLALKILEQEEGFKPNPYYCSENYPTYGHGFKIGNKHDPLPDICITKEESLSRLEQHIDAIIYSLSNNADTKKMFEACNFGRQAILVSLVYQIGMYGLLKFKKFLAAMNNKNYEVAGVELLNSLAAKQAPKRFKRNSDVIKTGRVGAAYDFGDF